MTSKNIELRAYASRALRAGCLIMLLTNIQCTKADDIDNSEPEEQQQEEQEQQTDQQITLLKEHYTDYLLSTAPAEQTIHEYLQCLDTVAGAFTDIDYESQVASNWKTVEHATRAAELAKYYYNSDLTPALFTRSELYAALESVMQYWYREQPYHLNNWYGNEISCPAALGEALVLMQRDMSEEQMATAVEVVYRYVSFNRSGSNLVFSSKNMMVKGMLTGDDELIHTAIESVESTIYISAQGVDGLRPDYSYIYHNAVQQVGNYGLNTLENLGFFCRIFSGTEFQFSTEKQSIINDFATEGFGWFLYKGYLDINSSARQYGADMLLSKGERALTAIANIVDDSTLSGINSTIGQKYFYALDTFFYRTQDWSASLRMHSTRVTGVEQTNDDNLKGYYTADGALITCIEGDDYENAAVLWDWRKLPSITCFDLSAEETMPKPTTEQAATSTDGFVNNSNFVGAAVSEVGSAAAMVLDKGYLYAKKSWLFTDDFILSMGSQVSSSEGSPYGSDLTTAVDQRELRSGFTHLTSWGWQSITEGVDTTIASDVITPDGVRFYSDNRGYIILSGGNIEAQTESRTGDWADVSASYVSGTTHSATMMTLYIDHNDSNSDYAYITLPHVSEAEVAAFDISEIEILECSEELHLVRYRDTYYTTAFSATEYSDEELTVECTEAGIYIFSAGSIIAAHDPTQQSTNEAMMGKINVAYK